MTDDTRQRLFDVIQRESFQADSYSEAAANAAHNEIITPMQTEIDRLKDLAAKHYHEKQFRDRRIRDLEETVRIERAEVASLRAQLGLGNHTMGGVCGHCSESGHSTAQCPNKES